MALRLLRSAPRIPRGSREKGQNPLFGLKIVKKEAEPPLPRG